MILPNQIDCMKIAIAKSKNEDEIAKLDCHIPPDRRHECIEQGKIYILKDDMDRVFGVLRYSFFWQTIPFLDLIYLDEARRGSGYGTEMMCKWECDMKASGHRYVMTSTQADETAWIFYEKLGYRRVGGFFPPDQDVEEWMYLKELG